MAYIPGRNSDAVAAQKYNTERLQKIYDTKLNHQLKELGKISAFREGLEEIKLEEQKFPPVPGIESFEALIANEYFIEGRTFGFSLIKNGLDYVTRHLKITELFG
jgi:hypothetical protein